MQRTAVFALVMLAGCSADEVTELKVTVAVTEDSVEVMPREADRPCTCNEGEFPAIGECTWSDDVSECTCAPPPATCLSTVELRRGGEAVESGQYSAFTGRRLIRSNGVGLDSSAELVLSGCGGSARIALQTGSFPLPTIDGMSLDADAFRVDYSTTGDPRSVMIFAERSDLAGGWRCRQTPTGQTSSFLPADEKWGLHALSEETLETELGAVHLHAGGAAVGPLVGQLNISPLGQYFGSVPVGNTSSAATFTVEPGVTMSVTITGGDASDFDIASNGCASPAQRSSCTIDITFSPDSAGAKTATLSVGGRLSALLEGTGLAASGR